MYFEGALARALREPTDRDDREVVVVRPVAGHRSARLEIDSADPTLALRLMGTRTLVPGQRRRIQDTGALVYEGTLRSPTATNRGPVRIHCGVRLRQRRGARRERYWSELHGEVAWVSVEGSPIVLNHGLLKDTLLDAAA